MYIVAYVLKFLSVSGPTHKLVRSLFSEFLATTQELVKILFNIFQELLDPFAVSGTFRWESQWRRIHYSADNQLGSTVVSCIYLQCLLFPQSRG